MKKFAILSLLACAGLFAAGCDDGDAGRGSIGVGIGIGVGHHHGGGHIGGGWGNGHGGGHVGGGWGPGHGGGHYGGGHGGGGHWGGGHGGHHYDMDMLASDDSSTMAADVSELSSKYQIPTVSAEKITTAFDNAETQGLGAFAAIGMGMNDFKALMNHTLPSDATVKNVSAKLEMSEDQTRTTLVSMMRNFSAQAANVNSEYWQHCVADGQWKTDQNASCSSLDISGCAPATGAKFCY